MYSCKKNRTDKFSLQRPDDMGSSTKRHRDLALAAASAAATAAFAFSAAAIIEHEQFVHGFHLLSV